MNAIELKSELVTIIQQIDDVNVLSSLKTLLTNHIIVEKKDYDFWFDLPPELQQDIDQGLVECDNDEVYEHNFVMSKYEKWL